MNIPKYDCHLHSYLSPCGKEQMTPENIIAQAKKLNLAGLCITDHLHTDTPLDQFDNLRDEFAKLDKQNIDIWIGCEVDILNPHTYTIKNEWTERFDLILASPIHWIDDVRKPDNFESHTLINYLCKMINAAVKCPGVNIVSHPCWLPEIEGTDIDTTHILKTIIDKQLLIPTFKLAKESHIAFEINPKVIKDDDSYEQTKRFYTQIAECGVKISLCSDAHTLSAMDIWHLHEKFTEDIGLTIENLWIPTKELPKDLHSKSAKKSKKSA